MTAQRKMTEYGQLVYDLLRNAPMEHQYCSMGNQAIPDGYSHINYVDLALSLNRKPRNVDDMYKFFNFPDDCPRKVDDEWAKRLCLATKLGMTCNAGAGDHMKYAIIPVASKHSASVVML